MSVSVRVKRKQVSSVELAEALDIEHSVVMEMINESIAEDPSEKGRLFWQAGDRWLIAISVVERMIEHLLRDIPDDCLGEYAH